jgi:D-proline reductase (dithiol) PrdB
LEVTLPIRYIELASEVTSTLPPLPIAEMGLPVLSPLTKPLSECNVMIVSSAGVHFRSDPPFQPTNDMTFRRIPQSASPDQLKPSHPAPVRRPGEADINVVHPYQRLAELAEEGFIGGVTDFHISCLGAIKKLTDLVTEMAPAMAVAAKAGGADLVLLVPLCPACHQAVGLMARVLEREGMPTVSMTGARDITERIRPPRAAFLNYPLGNSVGAPGDQSGQRDVLRAALQIAEFVQVPGTIVDLPFLWSELGWEAECADLYRREAGTVLSQRTKSEYDGSVNFAMQECTDICTLA